MEKVMEMSDTGKANTIIRSFWEAVIDVEADHGDVGVVLAMLMAAHRASIAYASGPMSLRSYMGTMSDMVQKIEDNPDHINKEKIGRRLNG